LAFLSSFVRSFVPSSLPPFLPLLLLSYNFSVVHSCIQSSTLP
jgi:hypothetical protein